MAPQDTAPKYAVDRKTNAPLMDICHAQGWAANEDYMTFEEAAEPITISQNLFKYFTGTSLYELKYFTKLTLANACDFSGGNWKVAYIHPINALYTTNAPKVGGTTGGTSPKRLIDFGDNIKSFHGWSFDYLNAFSIIVFRFGAEQAYVSAPAWDFNGQNGGKYGHLTIYVPDVAVDAYEASVWGQYGNTIKPLSEYDEKTTIKQILEQ